MTTTVRANPYTPATAPLPAITVTGRLDRLRATFDEHEVDALVVTTLANVRYLTGFTGSAAVLVVTGDVALLTTDGRYRTQSAEQIERAGAAAQVEIAIGPGSEQRLAALAALDGAGAATDRARGRQRHLERPAQLGRRSRRRQARPHRQCRRGTAGAQGRGRDRPHGAGRRHRRRRPLRGAPAHEPGRHRGALRPRARHRHAPRRRREHRLRDDRGRGRELGQAAPPPRLAADQRGRPRGRGLRRHLRGLPLRHDADLLRRRASPRASWPASSTWCRRPRPPAPPPCGPASRPRRSTTSAGQIIADAGWAERFEHGTGHGVGLDIHEAPTVSQLGTAILAPGFVVTVEPGVYLPGHGGVRVEDTVVVTEDGAAP